MSVEVDMEKQWDHIWIDSQVNTGCQTEDQREFGEGQASRVHGL